MYYFFYFPLGAEGTSRRVPILTYGLAVGLVVIHYLLHYNAPTVYLYPRLVLYTASPTLVQAFTSCFVHAGIWHLAGNLLYLIAFGPTLEQRMPRWFLLGFYLLCGMVSMVLQVELAKLVSPLDPPTIVLGASGAISGLLGLCLVRCWFARIRIAHATFAYLQAIAKGGVLALPIWVAVGVWALLQVIQLLISMDTGGRGDAVWAHVGGLATGALLGTLAGMAREGRRERRYLAVRKAMRNGNWYSALGDLEQLIEEAGDRPEFLREEAQCLWLANRRREAQAAYERLFRIHLRAGRWRDAADVAEEMFRESPGSGPHPRRLAALAAILEREDDLVRAAAFYERAGLLEGDPARSAGLLEYGAEMFLRRVGDLERAAQLFHEGAERLQNRREGAPPPDVLARIEELRGRRDECRRVLANRVGEAAAPA